MKTILRSRGHHYLTRASIFLITVALIAGTVGCGGGGDGDGDGASYTLIVDLTAGGVVAVNNVPIPGRAMFIYDPGTVVSLNATPDVGYQFADWTGNVSTIANVTAAITTITMNGDYSITANFALEIWDWYDLNAVRNNLTGSYLLMNNLNSATAGYTELASPTANGGKGWEPIGAWDWNQGVEEWFEGTFDGQGHQIRDLYINRTDESVVGLFSIVGMGGVIKNIGVVNVSVAGNLLVGGLVGGNAGVVSDSYSAATVNGNWSVGGLVGGNCGPAIACPEGTIINSYATGNVTGIQWVGGLVGINAGIVSESYSTGSVTGSNMTGGLAGMNDGTVVNSYSTGSVTGNFSVGGLVGDSYDSTVTNSFWDTETSGQNSSAGGTGKNTTEMQYIMTFSGAGWNITTVGGLGERNTTYIWNIVNGVTYPFLSWQP